MSDGIVKWRPSSGTIGAIFIGDWCDKCDRDRAYREGDGDSCDIVARTMIFDEDDEEYPIEWQDHPDRGPICTAFIDKNEPKRSPRCELTLDMFSSESAYKNDNGES